MNSALNLLAQIETAHSFLCLGVTVVRPRPHFSAFFVLVQYHSPYDWSKREVPAALSKYLFRRRRGSYPISFRIKHFPDHMPMLCCRSTSEKVVEAEEPTSIEPANKEPQPGAASNMAWDRHMRYKETQKTNIRVALLRQQKLVRIRKRLCEQDASSIIVVSEGQLSEESSFH